MLDRAWRDDGHVVGALARRPAGRPRAAGERDTEFVPRLIELCFQTAGVWELGTDRPPGAAHARRPRDPLRRRRRAGPAVRRGQHRDGRRRRRRRGRRRDGPRARAARGLPHDRAARRASTRTRWRRSARRWKRAAGACSDPSRRLAIVNRGEPAMRLIHAVRELNEQREEPIRVIALYTAAERQAMFVRHADEGTASACDLAPTAPRSATSTTRRSSARSSRPAPTPSGSAGASSPSTREFVELCERLGIVFVGPELRDHAPARRQDRGQAARRGRRRAGRALERRAGRHGRGRRAARRGDRLPADDQGGRGRRRARHPPRRRPGRRSRPRSRAPAPRPRRRSATTRC